MNEHQPEQSDIEFYCPKCDALVKEPLVCGDCLALICRKCGTPLEKADDLAMG